MTFDPDYGPPTNHENDPRNGDPLDSEIEDEEMSDAEHEARLADEHYGNDPDNR